MNEGVANADVLTARPSPGKPVTVATLGIDCGGTHTKLLLTSTPGGVESVVRRAWFPTPHHSRALEEMVDRVAEFVDGQRLASFGIALPGIISDDVGTVLTSTNLSWLEGQVPAQVLSGALRAPGATVNDGAATAMAEVGLGAAHGQQDVFVIALGTGIAGAHVVDGQIRRGAHAASGEIGHVALGGDRVCSCGQRGCLETYIGGSQLGERWRELSGREGTAKDLIDAAGRGDAGAGAILDEATSALARTVLAMVALVDPGMIVVGGGVSRARAQVVEPLAVKVHQLATFHHLPPIVPAALGVWGAAWGAILAAPGT